MLGYPPTRSSGATFAELTHPDDLAANLALHDDIHRGRRDEYVIEKRYRRGDGSYIWCRVNVGLVRSTDGDTALQIGQIIDITEHKSNADALEREARYDVLTGLATRKLLPRGAASASCSPSRRRDGRSRCCSSTSTTSST